MKFLKRARFLLIGLVLAAVGAVAMAQGGMVRLTTFGAQTNLTGLGYPCVTSCYVTLSQGTVTLNGATPITVANALTTANSSIIFTLKTVGGTVSPNAPNVLTITPGTGFTVGGTAADTSIYNYVILN
jgi:hypothetical protein